MFTLSWMTVCLINMALAENPNITSLKEQFPEEFQQRETLKPIPTRAGHLRFVGSELADPIWAPLYVERYLSNNEPPAVRRALLDLIFRSTKELPSEVIARFTEEPDRIRAEIIDMIPFGTIETELLEKDSSPLVRAALIRNVARTTSAPNDIIIRALQDSDPKVLADAARASHRRNCLAALPLLSRMVMHENGTVALRSLYAISKLDPSQAQKLVLKHALNNSKHTNLALFAESLL